MPRTVASKKHPSTVVPNFIERSTRKTDPDGSVFYEVDLPVRRGSTEVKTLVIDELDWHRLRRWIADGGGRRAVRVFDSNAGHRAAGRGCGAKWYVMLLDNTSKPFVCKYLHRWILGLEGAGRNVVTRHLNDSGMDNRRRNLESGTTADNAFDRVANSLAKAGVTEADILAKLDKAIPAAQIAREFGISDSSVKTVRNRARRSGRTFPTPRTGRPRKTAVKGAA